MKMWMRWCADLTTEFGALPGGRWLRSSTAELTFIAVGTPASGGKIDLKYVEAAASEIGAALRQKTNYTSKSTVIPGMTVGIVGTALESASGKIRARDSDWA